MDARLALRRRSAWPLLVVWASLLLPTASAAPPAVRRAHAHNDYYHERPLLDALERGFGSVEADVYLVDGRLLVGHDRDELEPDRTLQRLYLDPLAERIRRNEGRVYPTGEGIILLVDFKSEAEATFDALHAALMPYAWMLASVRDGQYRPGPVRVIVSGNRAKERIAVANPRYVGIEGRLSDLPSQAPDHLVPLISDNWTLHFTWRGEGEIPADERQKLRRIVQQIHDEGRIVRFWATPDRPSVWRELHEAQVDLINTDDLDGLKTFLERHE